MICGPIYSHSVVCAARHAAKHVSRRRCDVLGIGAASGCCAGVWGTDFGNGSGRGDCVFRSLGVDKRLSVLVEGESLFNDGIVVVIFSLAVGAGIAIAEGTYEDFHCPRQ